MTRGTRSQLLDRLREGPLPTSDWPLFAKSRKSLHVRIHLLRAQGYDITTTMGDRPKGQQGSEAGFYVLQGEAGQ